jgi:inosose dehydratase
MDSTEKVHLLYDTGHALYGGVDPLELVKKYADRIIHVHLKDIRKEVLEQVAEQQMSFLDSVKAGVFTVPGDGCINFKPIFEALADSGYKGWFVVEAEQDPARADPLEYARKARTYIRQTTGI